MPAARKVIALAGAGDLGKYICEELTADERFDVVVISRGRNRWFEDRGISVHISDYSEDSMLSILDSTHATALISCIRAFDTRYIDIHSAYLNACIKSKACKRFIPSEWAGNIEDYPLKPDFYGTTREPFRQILKKSSGIEWTLFNQGWFMDYFLPQEKTYIKPAPDDFPVDPNNWRACIRGTGDEPQSWTCAREVGKAVVELLAASEWEPITYVVGEWNTFNEIVKLMESLSGRPLKKSYKSREQIQASLMKHARDEDTTELEIAQAEDWHTLGASACPQEKTLRQRAKYFSNVHFSTVEELLRRAETINFI